MNHTAQQRSLTDRERELIVRILNESGQPGADELLAQVPAATVVGGPPTMLDIAVAPEARAASVGDGPLPAVGAVNGPDGDPLGEILIWVQDGRLSGVEYAWFSDEAPTELPPAEQVSVEQD